MQTLTCLLLVVMAVVWGGPAMAQDARQESLPLKIGVFEAPPFTSENDQGGWEGLSIDLWQRIVEELGRESTFQGFTDLAQLREALAAGEIDVILTVPATQEYETMMDLTQPYFRSGYGIAVSANQSAGSWLSYLALVDFSRIAMLFIGLVGLWLIAGGSLYLLERRRNPDMFGGGFVKGTGQGVWWAAVTMTTVGYGDKAPLTLAGRTIAVVWMFASIVLISSFTASIAAALTTEKLLGKVRGPQDLPHVRVGSVSNSLPANWLEDRGIIAAPYDAVSDGIRAVDANNIDAFVFDVAVLKDTTNSEFPGRVAVLPQVVAQYYVGIGVAHRNPLREAIDRALLGVIASEEWERLLARYGLHK